MARYIPKSKVSILETTGNEFIIASTKQPYKGKYMELSDGTFFAGNNPQNPGEELLKRQELNVSFGRSKNNSTYRKLQRPIYNELAKKANCTWEEVCDDLGHYTDKYSDKHYANVNGSLYEILDYEEERDPDPSTHSLEPQEDGSIKLDVYWYNCCGWEEVVMEDLEALEIERLNKGPKQKTVTIPLEEYTFLNKLLTAVESLPITAEELVGTVGE